MLQRLFIIKNNTHYLNVKNYIKTKEKAHNHIFLTVGKFEGYLDFINTIKEDKELELLGIIYTHKSSRIVDYWNLITNIIYIKKQAVKQKHFDEIIFSNYKYFLQHSIINHYSTDKIILLSDGAGIIVMANYRKKHKSLPFKSIPFGNNTFFREQILKIKPIKHLHFYTQINLDIAEEDSQEIFKFEGSKHDKVNTKKVYFVGSPLVELGFISLNKKISYLKELMAYYENYEFFYFPHRRESGENLEKYNFMQVIAQSNIPFEERMKQESELPGTIISFVSSIAINLAPIYSKIKFQYFPLSNSDLSSNKEFQKKYKVMLAGYKNLETPNFSEFPRKD
ncbi:hypothetical protein SAMN05444483_103203 [Salegentibacter echinorum]|uniref:Uncharacterized protein n=1 Tax=Salegentibacter echinorum TaxID=1073325 RepID=A0A1M5FI76_SALEC|nr:hypothetical protein [Salegentibacter echinorum]SHF91188.1 hypothetical protein SAMN05444483_103203 [Salegentibacter echinorum]